MNGLGPWWFPGPVRAGLTRMSRLFFVTASWDRHDEGYARADPPRRECDRRFLAAMLADAAAASTEWRMAACTGLAWTFWVAVRLFGWTAYGPRRNR